MSKSLQSFQSTMAPHSGLAKLFSSPACSRNASVITPRSNVLSSNLANNVVQLAATTGALPNTVSPNGAVRSATVSGLQSTPVLLTKAEVINPLSACATPELVPTPDLPPSPVATSVQKFALSMAGKSNLTPCSEEGTPLPLPPVLPTPKGTRSPRGKKTPLKKLEPVSSEESLPPPNVTDLQALTQMFGDRSVDQFLSDNNYVIIDKVINKDEKDDGYTVDYIKAFSPTGDIVFVKMEQPGSVSIQTNDLSTIILERGTTVSQSLKESTLSSVGNRASGVAFECDKAYCILYRNDEGAVREKTYVYTEGYSRKTLIPSNSPIAYPVITLSEIDVDPYGTIHRICESSRCIQKAALASLSEKFAKTRAEIISVLNSFDRLHLAFNKENEFRQAELNKLSEFWTQNRHNLECDPNAHVRQALITQNIYNRNQLLADMLGATDTFLLSVEELKDLKLKMSETHAYLFLKARQYLDPAHNFSGPLLDARQWGLPMELNEVKDFDLLRCGKWNVAVPETENVKILKHVLSVFN